MNHADWVTGSVLHQRYLKEVFQYVSRRVPREEADDVTMQVFATALEALPRFRGECPPRIWLLKIARGKVVDAVRRRASRREILASEMVDAHQEANPMAHAPAPAAEGPAAAFERAEERRTMHRLVNQLNQDQREALLLQYVEELSVAEIAEIMGRSTAAVDSLLQRARANLYRLGRSYFVDDGEETQR